MFDLWTLQAGTQPSIDHGSLTKEYPRYPSIFDITISETERQMLMVSIFVYNVSIQFLALFLNLCVIYSSVYLYSSTVGHLPLHESISIHYISWGPPPSGVQSLQDYGSTSLTSGRGVWPCECLGVGLVIYSTSFVANTPPSLPPHCSWPALSHDMTWLMKTFTR